MPGEGVSVFTGFKEVFWEPYFITALEPVEMCFHRCHMTPIASSSSIYIIHHLNIFLGNHFICGNYKRTFTVQSANRIL